MIAKGEVKSDLLIPVQWPDGTWTFFAWGHVWVGTDKTAKTREHFWNISVNLTSPIHHVKLPREGGYRVTSVWKTCNVEPTNNKTPICNPRLFILGVKQSDSVKHLSNVQSSDQD